MVLFTFPMWTSHLRIWTMLFVRYVLSFVRWNDLQFSNRTSLSSVTCSLTGAYYRLNAFSFRFPVILSVILDISTPPPPHRGEGGGGVVGVLGLIFAGYVPLASQIPYPIIVYFVANYRPHLSHFSANTKFSRSQLSIYEITLYWMKNTLLFTYSTNILARLLTVNMKNCLAPKIRKCATPF